MTLNFALVLDMPTGQLTIGPRNDVTREWLEGHGVHFFDGVLAKVLELWRHQGVSPRDLPRIALDVQREMREYGESLRSVGGRGPYPEIVVRACKLEDVVAAQRLVEVGR
jgi:hypothetical protein